MSNRDDRIRRQQAADGTRRACPGASSSAARARCSAALAVAPAVLAACGSSGAIEERLGRSAVAGGGKSVAISNWTELHRRRRVEDDFPKDTGIALTYHEDINDNNEYFAKIRPNLEQGPEHRHATGSCSPTGWRTG